MQPTVGRLVHYTNPGDRDGKYPPEIQAALITKVIVQEDWSTPSRNNEDSYHVSLRVFYETGDFWMQKVPYAGEGVLAGSEAARGKWAWPART